MARAKTPPTALAYAREVDEGRRPASRLGQLACARHLRDPRRQRTRAFLYYFDAEDAADRVKFFELTTHIKGEWAGQAGWNTGGEVGIPRTRPGGCKGDESAGPAERAGGLNRRVSPALSSSEAEHALCARGGFDRWRPSTCRRARY